MPFRPLALFAILCCPLPLLAQQTSPVATEAQTTADQQDIGALQAELAKTESERQRLADELDGAADHAELEQLSEQNLLLRERLNTLEQLARSDRQEQQRKWFITGGGTVLFSLFLGWILGRMGGRRKRAEWLN